MIDGEQTALENKGNRDNTCNTTCRVSSLGFHPGAIFINQEADNEITIRDDSGKEDSWYLDDSMDNIPNNPKESATLASQDEVGRKVCNLLLL